ncbi:MAG: penicillin-binding transpeptidase domain-containing protein [Clostridiales bacterium]
MSKNNKIVHTLALFCILFFSIIAYLTYFQLFKAEDLKIHPNNGRRMREEAKILRGSILDKNGTILAQSTRIDANTQKREYIFGSLYCHIIGYSSVNYGKHNLERIYDNELLGLSSFETLNDLKSIFSKKKIGNNIQITIDNDLQKTAQDSMGNYKGALVAIEPSTGKILAMVSNPGFDPNKIDDEFTKLTQSPDGNFTSRALLNKYPPGSTFKVLTSVAAYENNLGDFSLNDEGSTDIDGKLFKNYNSKAYGEIGIKDALSVSSNVFYAKLGLEIGDENLLKVHNKAFINKEMDFELDTATNTLDKKRLLSSKTELAAVSMGQGTLQVTPFYMAAFTSAIANNGKMMQPYLVNNIQNSEGKVKKETKAKVLSELTTSSIADNVTDIMVSVVDNGTGTSAQIPGIKVAGKTGTAENEVQNKEHAWFIAFAPADDPKIAIAVINEYSGETGGSICAPIAKQVISSYLGN